MLTVVVLGFELPVIILNYFILIVESINMLTNAMLSVIVLGVVLSVAMQSIIILSVVILNAVVPLKAR